MKPNSKSLIAYDYISNAIYNREIEKDSFLEPEIPLAKRLKISRVSLRRALDLLIAEGLIERIPNKGYKVLSDYSIKSNEPSQKVILFIHSYEMEVFEKDAFHMSIWSGVQKCAHENNLKPVILSLKTIEDIETHKDYIINASSGIVCDSWESEKLELLSSFKVPIVMVDCVGESKKTDMVIQDNFGGIKKAVTELTKRNTKKIGYLDSSLQLVAENRNLHAIEREQSFLQNTSLLNYPKESIFIEKSSTDAPSIKRAFLKLFEANIDGLIIPFSICSDTMKPSFWDKLPAQIKVIIWGGKKISHPNIIYYGQLKWDPKIMGQESVLRLIQRIKQPKLNPMKILVPVNLTDINAVPSTKNDL